MSHSRGSLIEEDEVDHDLPTKSSGDADCDLAPPLSPKDASNEMGSKSSDKQEMKVTSVHEGREGSGAGASLDSSGSADNQDLQILDSKQLMQTIEVLNLDDLKIEEMSFSEALDKTANRRPRVNASPPFPTESGDVSKSGHSSNLKGLVSPGLSSGNLVNFGDSLTETIYLRPEHGEMNGGDGAPSSSSKGDIVNLQDCGFGTSQKPLDSGQRLASDRSGADRREEVLKGRYDAARPV
eukprot:gnl/MRDRNA2_/MRDRNA2_81986_c0_seq1.p1 gnl/MRDRNA2_/MRDRNA2_81986_c0~~gnl/MRDRNA2_/MRDRNA2_81986_c0_seq1.p1  ORF type:complete len:239 (+),score=54.43 gnl/MRDRNA2_/MRDRNA2_81986_c0_seq1:279-995(+)